MDILMEFQGVFFRHLGNLLLELLVFWVFSGGLPEF